MIKRRPISFIAFLIFLFSIAMLLNVASTKKDYSESYPAVVCPPTLTGLNSQISLSSKLTPFQSLQNRTAKTKPTKVLRLPILRDSVVMETQGSTPVAWQSRNGSWAGGVLCSGPSSSQWFVGSSANVTSRAKLIIINSGLSEAVIDVKTFTENGKQPLKTVNVTSRNFLTIPVDSLAPGDKTLTVNVVPRSGRINAYLLDEQMKGLQSLGGDFINPMALASKTLVIPAIPNQIPKNGKKVASAHILRILAPGEVDANFKVEVISNDGVFVPVGYSSRLINSGMVTDFKLAPNISANVFAIRVIASEDVVASVQSSVVINGKKDIVWSTPTPSLNVMTIAITGLTPLIAFTGEKIEVSLDVKLLNGKVIRESINGSDFLTWRAPISARSLSITRVGKSTHAGALVSSANGYGYFPIEPGSILTKTQIPDSNIRVLNP